MQITIRDILQLKKLKSLKLLNNSDGLTNLVSKVGILDYEFTRQGHAFCTDNHWIQGEFVLATFSYARENPNLLVNAVKQLQKAGTSGLAIKNVYQLEIPDELIKFANRNKYPLFLFTDESLFFEDIIVNMDRLQSSLNNMEERECRVAKLLTARYNSNELTAAASELVPCLPSHYRVAYVRLLQEDSDTQFHFRSHMLHREEGVVIPYQNNYFFVCDQGKNKENFMELLMRRFPLQEKDCRIGISDEMLFPSHLKKGLFQCMHAEIYGRITLQKIVYYKELGVYQMLIPFIKKEAVDDFYNSIMPAILENDSTSDNSLLNTALVFEANHGNIKEMAKTFSTHENTIRYRLKKLADLFGSNVNDTEFTTRLTIAVKLYRLHQVMEDKN